MWDGKTNSGGNPWKLSQLAQRTWRCQRKFLHIRNVSSWSEVHVSGLSRLPTNPSGSEMMLFSLLPSGSGFRGPLPGRLPVWCFLSPDGNASHRQQLSEQILKLVSASLQDKRSFFFITVVPSHWQNSLRDRHGFGDAGIISRQSGQTGESHAAVALPPVTVVGQAATPFLSLLSSPASQDTWEDLIHIVHKALKILLTISSQLLLDSVSNACVLPHERGVNNLWLLKCGRPAPHCTY